MNRSGQITAVLLTAVGLLLLAVVVRYGSGSGSADEALTIAEAGEDHIDAAEAAHLIMTAPETIRLVDLRPPEEFATRTLPGAVNMSMPDLIGAKGRPILASGAKTIILFSNGPTHPGQAWVALRQAGQKNVRVLDGGLETFDARVLTPPSQMPGAVEATVKKEAPLFALRRAFLLERERASVAASDPATLAEPALVSVAWAFAHRGEVRFIDARESAAEFAAYHIPGAVHASPASLRTKAHDRDLMLKDPAALAARFGELGIGRDQAVVVYADDRYFDAGFVALALLAVGAERIAILDGGIRAWAAAKHALSDVLPQPTPVVFTAAAPREAFAIKIDEVASARAAKTTTIVDVRPPDQFQGKVSTEARPGHIPGAKNRPIALDVEVGPAGAFLRGKAELSTGYAALGLGADTFTTVSCRTGHQAAGAYFTLRHVLGQRNVRWFNGSWTEWAARADLPAEVAP